LSIVRVAIVGTPRSGNMWLRRLLASSFELEELAADTPAGVPWRALPDRAVLQLHWHPTEELLLLLERNAFRTVALARHPLDVLISILQFAQREPRTARWLNGEGGDERTLIGADPCSIAFREYATGPRARALLETTVLWRRSGRLDAAVGYEDLVAGPHGELSRLAETLAEAAAAPARDVVAANDFAHLRAESRNGHFWRGRPGLWRTLLPAELARQIAAAQEASFVELGYDVDPDPALTEQQARGEWARLQDGTPVRPPPTVSERTKAGAELAGRAPEELVDELYRLILRRPPDAEAAAVTCARLRAGRLSPATLVHELVTSDEGERVRLLDDALAYAAWSRAAGERPRALVAPVGGSERLIEIPWTLARYRGEPSVLDVGYAFSEPAYLAALPSLGAKRLAAVDLAEASAPGVETIEADVRALPFPAGSFDVAVCISTLQWIGADNRIFGLPAESDGDGPLRALRELRRVLVHHGRLLLTVPCGEPQDLGWFVQHDRDGWRRLFAAADFHPFEEQVYELTDAGWRASADFSERGVRYAERGSGASALLCTELRPGRLRQAVRRTIRHAGRRLRGETTEDR
jgi:SAM-dependent methyltransferase